jgi:hypothetical protein
MPKFEINDRVQMPGVPFTVTVLEIGHDDEVGEVFKFMDPGGHEFTGRLDCAGEETGDLWRLEVHDRQAVKVTPRIVWPDGSEEPSRA